MAVCRASHEGILEHARSIEAGVGPYLEQWQRTGVQASSACWERAPQQNRYRKHTCIVPAAEERVANCISTLQRRIRGF